MFTSAHTDTHAHIGSCTGELSAVVWRVWIGRVRWGNGGNGFDILAGRREIEEHEHVGIEVMEKDRME